MKIFWLAALTMLLVCGLPAQSQTTGALDWNTRWDNYLERTYSWKRIGIVAAETAFDQTFQLRKCGRPPYCFPHDFGGALARRTTRTTIELAAGALLHEDIRRRPSNLPGFRQRVVYALIHAPLAKGPEGEWRPAYSRFAGTFAGRVIYTAWEGKPLTAPRLFGGFAWSTTNYFQDALWTEFEPDLKRVAIRFAHKFHRREKAPAPLTPPPPPTEP
jgi:hypothetical protein